MIIKTYAQFWNPEIVDWGSRGKGNCGKLLGKVRINGHQHTIDFWDAVGIYVLQSDFRPVYVGKAIGTKMGPRLRDHLTDRFAGRWDMFSWFSLSTMNTTYLNTRKPGWRQLDPDTVIDTLESIGILMTDAPLNRRREKIPGAVEAIQPAGDPKTLRSYLEQIVEGMGSMYESVEEIRGQQD